MTPRRWAARLVLIAALVTAATSLWLLERARIGVEITSTLIGATPVTIYRPAAAQGPVVVAAHGFAGSRQMMQAYALTLARGGYVVYAFDFEGHGRNTTPMYGDLSAIEGTTQRLIRQTETVIDAARQREVWQGPVALLGHSMATDILIRVAGAKDGIGPLVLLSAFSQAVTPTAPPDLLLITGQWERSLRQFALSAAQMVDPAAAEGAVARQGTVRRQASVAPNVEHVGILYSRAGQAAALAWLNTAYDKTRAVPLWPTGPALLTLIAALVALAFPLSRVLPQTPDAARPPMARHQIAAVVLVPTLVAPLMALVALPRLLPVLVADYLAIHLLVFGGLQLALLWRFGQRPGRVTGLAVAALLFWGLVVFGAVLDRYAANFWPTPERLVVIAMIAIGAVPFMLADALMADCGRRSPVTRGLARLAFLVSLGIAVSLDFEGLFFLAMIAPVIVLFYVLFGLMGRWIAQRTGASATGLALGLILAWALGVSFPLFAAV